jgi:hypothetical protein
MIRALFRLIGIIFLAAGFILLISDGAKSIADNRLSVYKLGQVWNDVHAASLPALRALVDQYVPSWVWDPGVLTILDQPGWLVLGVIGVVFVLLGRKKRPLIGYAR